MGEGRFKSYSKGLSVYWVSPSDKRGEDLTKVFLNGKP